MRSNHSLHLANKSGELIVSKVRLADSFLTRLKGLMFSSRLDKDEGLLICQCKQVHTHFMRYPLDIVFLDSSLQVIEIVHELKPWRFSKFYKNAHYVLEMSANSLPQSIKLGSKLALINNQS